tara:strand:- start:652 stop:993 length:342 start_codon:yes stop_codon:yes gene_type:complete
MNATLANLINSFTLIIIGFWGYLDFLSPTALIPVSIGVILLACYRGIKNQNKIISHVAVLLTLLILIALVGMRLPKSMDKGGIGLLRVMIMIVTSTFSMIFFIRSFIAARKNK